MSLSRSEVDTIEDQDSAARAWLELEHEREQAGMPHGRVTENRAATAKLEQAWPGARQHAATATSDQLGGLPARLKRTRDAHRQNIGMTAADAARTRRQADPATAQRREARELRRTIKPSPGGTGAGRRRVSSRGRGRGPSIDPGDVADAIAPVGVSYGRLAFQAAGWAVGLSLLYLILSNSEKAPKGSSAVELTARGISNLVTALVSPLADPLSPTRAAAPAKPHAVAPVTNTQRVGAVGRGADTTTPAPTSGVGTLRPGSGSLGGFPTNRSPSP